MIAAAALAYGLSPAILDSTLSTGCRPQYWTRRSLRADACDAGLEVGGVGYCELLLVMGGLGGVPVAVADVTGEVVEEEALGAGDGAPVVVMGPGGDDE